MRTLKDLYKSSPDIHAALLSYHSTPLSSGYTPSQLLMSRHITAQVPIRDAALKPKVAEMDFEAKEEQSKMRSALSFKSSTQPLATLAPGQVVWINDRKQSGVIKDQVHPRSYIVSTPTGDYRRNRIMLNKIPTRENIKPKVVPTVIPNGKRPEKPAPPRIEAPKPVATPDPPRPAAPDPPKATRSGRIVNTPARYK